MKTPPFPVKIREHSFVTNVVSKSDRRANIPEEKIKVDPQVALVKDLVTENIDGSSISFCAAASNIVQARNISVVTGIHVVSVKIGAHNYYGLFDLGDSIRAIPFSLYQEVMN